MQKVDVKNISIPCWPTPKYKIDKAFADGSRHAINHYYKEEADPDWPFGVKSWAINPYSENRPGAFYAWLSGFSEMWGELIRNERMAKDEANT